MVVDTKLRDAWKKINSLPFVSIVLVAVNAVVFIICQLPGQELYNKGCSGIWDVLLNREYGRLLWCTFLHSDVEHLFNNMILLLFMGSMLEQNIGHLPYGIIYFLSGIGSSAISLCVKWINNDWSVSLGASGAIFGLDGLLLAMVLILKGRLENIIIGRVMLMIALSLYSGFTSSLIDNAAHVGGLLIGFCLGIIVCTVIKVKERLA